MTDDLTQVFSIIRERLRPVLYGFNPEATGEINRLALNSTLAASGANGAVIELPSGVFDIDQCVIVPPGEKVTLSGSGNTTLRTTSPTENIIDFHPSFGSIENLSFSSSVVRTGGTYVSVKAGAHRFEINDFKMLGAKEGLRFADGISTFTARKGKIFETVGAYGIGIVVEGGFDGTIADVVMDGPNNARPFAGIYISSCGDVSIEDCNIINQGVNLFINPTAGKVAASVFANNCFFDTSDYGMRMIADAGNIVRPIFDQCWFSGHVHDGVRMQEINGGQVRGAQFIGCQAYINGGDGFRSELSGDTDLLFMGCRGAGNAGGGISMATPQNRFQVLGCNTGNSDGFNGNGVGVYLDPGCNYYQVSNNMAFGNVNSGIIVPPALPTRVCIGNLS